VPLEDTGLGMFQKSEEDLKGVWITRTSRTQEEIQTSSPGPCTSLSAGSWAEASLWDSVGRLLRAGCDGWC